MKKSYLFFKSFADRIFALFLLLTLFPLFILIIILLLINHGFPIFFVQKRPGLFGKPFKLYKFRTMNNKKGFSIQSATDFGNGMGRIRFL